MTFSKLTRRAMVATGAATLMTASTGLIIPARAAGLAPTPTMRGGSNNYGGCPGRC